VSEHEAPVHRRAQAGYQWLVEDNDPPETAGEKKEQARQRKKLVSKAEAVGDWERGLTEQGAEMLPGLHLPDQLVHHGGAPLFRYQSESNAFNGSMRLAMNSLGRAKDLAAAGAPAEPEAVSAKLAKKMKAKAGTLAASAAFDDWSSEHGELEETFDASLAEKAQLQGAIEKLLSARTYLAERRKQAEKEHHTAEKLKIDATVDTAMEILGITMQVYSLAYGGTKMKLPGLSEELMKDPTRDPGKVSEALKPPTQLKGSVKEFAKAKGKEAASKAFDLKAMVRFALGEEGKYDELVRKIAKIEEQLADLKYERENLLIQGATSELMAWKLQVAVSERAVLGKKTTSRRAAHTFARALGGGQDVTLITHMAEAYQQLSLFGGRAARHIDAVAGTAPKVLNWVHRMYSYVDMREGDANDVALQRLGSDAESLIPRVQGFVQSAEPEWQRVAGAWRGFIKEIAGRDLDAAEDSAEAQIGH
jgi:hypothetical protein